jgi:hypothetical protein
VGANLMSRATYQARGIPSTVDTIDELAGHLDATGDEGR